MVKLENLRAELSRADDERNSFEIKYNKAIMDLKKFEDTKNREDLDELKLLFTKINIVDDKITFLTEDFKEKLNDIEHIISLTLTNSSNTKSIASESTINSDIINDNMEKEEIVEDVALKTNNDIDDNLGEDNLSNNDTDDDNSAEVLDNIENWVKIEEDEEMEENNEENNEEKIDFSYIKTEESENDLSDEDAANDIMEDVSDLKDDNVDFDESNDEIINNENIKGKDFTIFNDESEELENIDDITLDEENNEDNEDNSDYEEGNDVDSGIETTEESIEIEENVDTEENMEDFLNSDTTIDDNSVSANIEDKIQRFDEDNSVEVASMASDNDITEDELDNQIKRQLKNLQDDTMEDNDDTSLIIDKEESNIVATNSTDNEESADVDFDIQESINKLRAQLNKEENDNN